jgi:hypothetical protein
MSSPSVVHSFSGTSGSKFDISLATTGHVSLAANTTSVLDRQIKVSYPRYNDLQLLPNVRFTGDAPGFATFYSIAAGAAPSATIDVQQITYVHTTPKHLHFSAQFPHTWCPGTSVTPHIHWSPNTTMPNGQAAVFQLVWQIREIALAAAGYDDYDATLGTNNYRSIIAIGTGLGGSGNDEWDPLPPATTTYTKTSHVHYMSNFQRQTISFDPTHYPMSCIVTGCISRLTDANVPGTGVTDPNRYVDNYADQIFLIGFDIHIQNDLLCGDGGPPV